MLRSPRPSHGNFTSDGWERGGDWIGCLPSAESSPAPRAPAPRPVAVRSEYTTIGTRAVECITVLKGKLDAVPASAVAELCKYPDAMRELLVALDEPSAKRQKKG
jgi:hypothetical protein